MNDREHARELLSVAEKDLRALEGMTDAETFAEEVFGFHAQQSVEKTLKAWIAAHGEEYALTHSIAALLAKLKELGCDVGDFWDLTRYNAFAVQFRYEALLLDETPLDRRAAIASVRELFDRVRMAVEDAKKNL